MSSKLIFLLLTALLLVQCSVGKPKPDADIAAEVSKEVETKKECDAGDLSESTSEEKSKEVALFLFRLGEYTEIADKNLNISKKLMQDVVADLNAMEEKSEALKIKTDMLGEILSNLKKIDLKNKKNMDWKLILLDEIGALLEDFNTTATENPSAEYIIIEAFLKKHGIKKILDGVKVKFFEFAERFYVPSDKYWNSLTPEEQIEFEKFAEWFKLLKEETNFEKKIMMFHEFFELNEKSE